MIILNNNINESNPILTNETFELICQNANIFIINLIGVIMLIFDVVEALKIAIIYIVKYSYYMIKILFLDANLNLIFVTMLV